MNATVKWILAIVGLLGANVTAMMILATSAHRDNAQIIPDYYARAATYDDAMAEAARSRSLGWSTDVTMTAGPVEVHVRDATGHALEAADVRVAGYQRSKLAGRFEVRLTPVGDGTYRAPVPSGQGVHDLAITVEREGRRFTDARVVEAR